MDKLIDKKIVIYGTGNKSRDFITSNEDLCIVGVLDRFRISGEFCQLPIITWEDIKRIDVDILVIASADFWYKEIYNRIFSQCMSKGLRIYTTTGQDLIAYFGNPYKPYAKELDIATVKKLIEAYDVVSFDVFDTLLIRTVLNPCDVFEIVSAKIECEELCDDFKKYRCF